MHDHVHAAILAGQEPECLTADEWDSAIRLGHAAEGSSHQRGEYTRELVMRNACGDCLLSYQLVESLHGRCHPPVGARTPLLRAEAGDDGMADEPL